MTLYVLSALSSSFSCIAITSILVGEGIFTAVAKTCWEKWEPSEKYENPLGIIFLLCMMKKITNISGKKIKRYGMEKL